MYRCFTFLRNNFFILGSLTVVDDGVYAGLCSQLSFKCTACNKKTTMLTSPKTKNSKEINIRANLAMSELGLARTGMQTICSVIGMPPPAYQNSWDMCNKTICSALEEALSKEYERSGKKLRQHLGEEDSSILDNSDPILDVVVSYDGTWHHRGFKSSQGVGVVMSVDTGEILDAEVISKVCETCQRSTLDKNSPEYALWLQQHKESGNCFCNFEGPSTGMETAAAKTLWSRSIAKHKMRYIAILSDGDNKTLQALNELQPYGSEVTITKLECVNHIHKRMGTGLRNLLKTNPAIRGGSGGLTGHMINKLSSYYRKHIIDFTTDSKDSTDIEEAVKQMKVNILASLHHSVRNDDPAEQHKFCMNSAVKWCKYKNSLNNSQASSSCTQKKDSLPQSYLAHMLPLYSRLSAENLLKRCTAGLTQNQNEGFNSTLWKRCPKERYFGTGAVKRALALSVLSWNTGRQSLLHVLEQLGIETNVFSKQGVLTKDKRRLSDAQQKAEKSKKRKISRQPDGNDYSAGAY